jgi:hypothetical protein
VLCNRGIIEEKYNGEWDRAERDEIYPRARAMSNGDAGAWKIVTGTIFENHENGVSPYFPLQAPMV